MISFNCTSCGQRVYFDNLACTRCGSELAYDPLTAQMRVPTSDDVRCANRDIGCNWLLEDGTLCRSCALTRTRPAPGDPDVVERFASAEAAKRRLHFQTDRLGLDISRVAFDLLSSRVKPVTTGHADGVITLDLSEADDVVRTRMQASLGEAYRTLLGHFRHEIGHFLWMTMVDGTDHVASFRATFGDERADYVEALEAHYAADHTGRGWQESFVSVYATAHPWEDFAESVAHYLHIRDTLETTAAFGVTVNGPDAVLESDPDSIDADRDPMAVLIGQWLPLTYALNAINRSMGAADLYPFVLPPTAIGKLAWVHRLFTRA